MFLAIRKANFLSHILSISLIVFIWSLIHTFSLGWGRLLNPECFAIDTMPSELDMRPYDMMNRNNFQYPPLQYLIAGAICPPQPDSKNLSDPQLISLRSDKIFKTRLLSALMSLGTALIIYLIAFILFSEFPLSAFIAPLLFLLNPLSIYYSNTSNMDQPYTFWWAFSYLNVLLAEKIAVKKSLLFLLFQILAGVTFGLAFCTKDQVYSLYFLPLFYYISLKWKQTKSLKIPSIILFSWAIPFLITTALIYKLAGGWNVLLIHFKWITNQEHQLLYSQCGSGFLARLQFILKPLKDLCICLDWTIILLLLLSAVSVFFLNDYTLKANNEIIAYLIIFLLITFLSLELFYIQVVRFSFPRYYLPIIVPVSIIIAGTFNNVIKSKIKILTYLFSFLLICHSILGIEFITTLNNDSRTNLKNLISEILSQNHNNNTKIALTGCTNIRKVAFKFNKDGSVHRKYVLVNEPLPTFGFISKNQKSIHNDSVSLLMYDPDIVITSNPNNNNWENILNKCGYSFISSIEPYKTTFPSLFKHNCPNFKIYFRKHPLPDQDKEHILREALANSTFEENLMRLSHYVDIPQIDRQLLLIGKYFPSFIKPDIENYHINPIVFCFLADAYETTGRINEASKTWEFIKNSFHRQDIIDRYNEFSKKYLDF